MKARDKEILLILCLWLVIFMMPVAYFEYASYYNLSTAEGDSILSYWVVLLPFFILHLLHHFLLLPRYMLRKRWVAYSIGVFLCLAGMYGVDSLLHQPLQEPRHGDRPPMHEMAMPMRGDMPPLPDKPIGEDAPPPEKEKNMKEPKTPLLSSPEVVHLVLALLMICLDVSVAIMRENKRMRKAENMHLEHELQYLRYQINPHFFMNTLHNIRALMELDIEQAKISIVELSQMMRFVLYEGDQKMVPLEKEIDFLKMYISLMRMRYHDEKVELRFSFPDKSTDAFVPPLILGTFIENAFKHGISYREKSFIFMEMFVKDGFLHFSCINSKHPVADDDAHGVGLQNVRKRLDLIFGSNYSLVIDEDNKDVYSVTLSYPINHDTLHSNRR